MVMVRVVRTTRDGGGGRTCGIVTGTGPNPQAALAALQRAAENLAQQTAQEAEAAATAAPEADEKADRNAPEARRREQDPKLSDGPQLSPGAKTRQTREPRMVRPPEPGPWRPKSAPPGSIEPPSAAPGGLGQPREWRFEVVDVRLTPGPTEGGGTGWLAYGTLAREGHPK